MQSSLILFCRYFPPAKKAGGPILSISNLVFSLSSKGLGVKIFAGSKDLCGSSLDSGETLRWTEKVAPAEVVYVPTWRKLDILIKLAAAGKLSDRVVYFNDLFAVETLLGLILAKLGFVGRVVIAPRGQLLNAAVNHKPFRKRLFLAFATRIGSGALFHSTSQAESKSIATYFSRSRVYEIQNIGRVLAGVEFGQRDFRNTIFMVGRVVRHKRIELGIRLAAGFFKRTHKRMKLVIAGFIEDREYYKSAIELARKSDVDVNFLGNVDFDTIASVYKSSLCLLSCSCSENYGHALHEALGSGVPVVLTGQTPLSSLGDIPESGVTYFASEQHGVQCLVELNELTELEYKKRQLGAKRTYDRLVKREILVQEYMDLLGRIDEGFTD